tara:strand:+ start:103 stop:765 length:663 start_codon:yes stop_codon:yes gene_type:complete
MQRFFDVLLSFLAIFILSPILLPVAFILKFTGEGEIIYTQSRSGFGGKEFGLYKFATMLKNSPNIGAGEITLKSDPRVLPFGKFLRKTKINEIPQLFNILVGDMSVVGPRPMVMSTYLKYPSHARSQIDSVRPGLTGIGSIIFRDEEEYLSDRDDPLKFYEDYIIPYKSDLEIWFIKNNSFWLYVKIIFITAWVVFFPNSKIHKKVFNDLPQMPEIFEDK